MTGLRIGLAAVSLVEAASLGLAQAAPMGRRRPATTIWICTALQAGSQ